VKTGGGSAAKTYDRAYFDRWYRDPGWAVIQRDHLERRVRLAVAAAEYALDRRIGSVLDVGCGEAPWRALLRRLRPRASYAGLDPSPYAARRFGRTRNIVQAGVGDVGTRALATALTARGARPPFDLIVCSDVLHYVPTAELARGLTGMAGWLGGGLAFLEFFAREDATEGDADGFQPRSAATYARHLRTAGLVHLGLHCYVGRALGRELMTFERGWAAPASGRRPARRGAGGQPGRAR
jgi:SAM-dependent methyltransferase